MMNVSEFGLIDFLQGELPNQGPSIIKGIGDDAAVVDIGLNNDYLLLSSDSIVENVHFNLNNSEPYLIGRKAIGCALSDIAAMGGYPLYTLIDIGCPKYMSLDIIKEIARGIRDLAQIFNVNVIGGDTTGANAIFISVKVVGKVEKGNCVFRSGARAGDFIWVSGALGGSIYGRHLTVNPRIPEARHIVLNYKPSAMIDISDGLCADLGHICRASMLSAELWAEDIPVHKDAKDFKEALNMGEDYELVFCLDPGQSERLRAEKSDYQFYCIGQMIEAPVYDVYVKTRSGTLIDFGRKGFEHF